MGLVVRAGAIAGLATSLIALAACSSDPQPPGQALPTYTPTTTSAAPSATASVEEQIIQAVVHYDAAVELQNTTLKPVDVTLLRTVAIEPELGSLIKNLTDAKSHGVTSVGESQVTKRTVTLKGAQATYRHCWQQGEVRVLVSGTPQPTRTGPKDAPLLVEHSLREVGGVWKVASTTFLKSC